MRQAISINDVEPGAALPPFMTTVSRTDIVKYAGAGGDFNPLHHDDELAKSIGLPSVFAMGLLHGGYLTKVLTDWAGPAAVKRYTIRFLSPAWPGDTLVCGGSVREVSDDGVVCCDLFVDTDRGARLIEGEAELLLPAMTTGGKSEF